MRSLLFGLAVLLAMSNSYVYLSTPNRRLLSITSGVARSKYVLLHMIESDDGGDEKKKKKKGVRIARVNSGIRRSLSKNVAKKPKKKVRLAPPAPEFSRIVNIANIPERKSVLCRLIANPRECSSLAERFEIPEIVSFSSNVTVSREMGGVGLYVEGEFAVEIGSGSDLLPTTEIASTFETNLLVNLDGSMSFEESTDYDDEVGESGDIDLGEIAAQYFGIEMYS